MIANDSTPTLREILGITHDQRQRISDFLQGSVYCWCKNRPEEWFSLRKLMGGDNFDWAGTPLAPLYERHAETAETPVKEAGKDAGWFLKRVIVEDQRAFETREGGFIREYRWLGEDENT